MDDYEKDRKYFKQFKGFKDLMFGVKHKMSEDYIISCLKMIEAEKLKKDVKKLEKDLEKLEKTITKKE